MSVDPTSTFASAPPLTAAALKAMLTVTPASVNADAPTGSTVTWTFNSGVEAFNFLPNGKTLVLVYTIKATDSNVPATFETTTVTISITGTNDGPVLPPSREPVFNPTQYQDKVPQDTFLVLPPVTVTDVDSNTLRVAIRASNGTVSLPAGAIADVDFDARTSRGDGTDDAYMVFTGTLLKINAALQAVKFTPTAGYAGQASIEISVTDEPSVTPAASALVARQVIYINVLDKVAPEASFQAITTPRNTAVNEVVVTFSESVTGVDKGDFSLTRGGVLVTLTSGVTLTGSGTRWVISGLAGLTGTDGDYVLTLTAAGSGIQDAAGNAITADATVSWKADMTAPTGTPTAVSPSTRNKATALTEAVVNFSEVVSGVTKDDFRLTVNGSAVSLLRATLVQDGVDLTKWTIGNLDVLSVADGRYELKVVSAGSEIVDAAGNRLSGDVTWTWTMDTAKPTASFASIETPRNNSVSEIAVTFTEAVTGVLKTDFTLTRGGTQVSLADATVTPATLVSSNRWVISGLSGLTSGLAGTVSDYVLKLTANSTIKDAAGNEIGADASTSWQVDKTVPTVAFETFATPRNSALNSITMTFSEAVTGLEKSDFALTRGVNPVSLANATLTGSGTTWTLVGLSGATVTDGIYKLALTGSVNDLAGNPVAVSPMAPNVIWDKESVVPTVVLAAVADQKNADAATVSVKATFSEKVTGVSVEDFQLTRNGAELSLADTTLVSSPDGKEWTLGNLAGMTSADGAYRLTLKAYESGIVDTAGSLLTAGASEDWNRDTVRPAATFSAITSPRNTAVNEIVVTFEEAVTGVDKNDFSLTKGGNPVTLTAGVTVTGSGTRRVISGLAGLTGTDGDYVLKLTAASSGIQDAAGNAIAADATVSWTADITAPTGTPTPVSPSTRNTPLTSAVVKFSEIVSGVTKDDFRLTVNGSAVSLLRATLVQDGVDLTKWTIGNLDVLSVADGRYELKLVSAGSEIVDAAGNRLSSDMTWTWTMDTAKPTASFAIVPAVRSDGLGSIVVTFSKSVTGVDYADFELTRDGGSNIITNTASVTGAGTTWTLGNLTALTGTAGSYALRLKAAGSSIQDAAGNVIAADASTSWQVDKTVPTVTFETFANPRNSALNSITMTFSEAVTGLEKSDFALTRGVNPVSLANATLTGSGTTWTLVGLSGATVTDGIYKLALTGSVNDLAGNPVAVSPMAPNVIWDKESVVPTVALAAVADQKNSDVATNSVKATFSEKVTGVGVEDFQLTRDGAEVSLAGATSPIPSSDGKEWTLTFPTGLTSADGAYRLTLRAYDTGIADTAGNLLTTGASEDWGRDTVLPQATFSSITSPRNTAVNEIVVTFTEAVTGVLKTHFTLTKGGVSVPLTAATVTGSGKRWVISGLSSLAGSDGDYVLKLTATGSGIQDAAGNAIIADATVSWTLLGTSFTASISQNGTNPLPSKTNTATNQIVVEFTRPIYGLSTSSFLLRRGTSILNLKTATLTQDAVNKSRWTLGNLANLTRVNGSYTLALASVGPKVVDLAGNLLKNAPTEAWSVDTTLPTLLASTAPTGIQRVNAGMIKLSFSESVTNVTKDTIALTRNGEDIPLTGRVAVVPSTDSRAWTVDLTTLSQNDGDFVLTAKAGITDLFGNALNTVAAGSWTLDKTSPTVAIDAIPGPVNGPVVAINVVFSEPVTGVDSRDFVLSRNGQMLLDYPRTAKVSQANPSGTMWTISNLSTLTRLAGRYEVKFVANGTVLDRARNTIDAAGLTGSGTSRSWDLSPLKATFAPVGDDAASPSAITIVFNRAVSRLMVANLAMTRNGLKVDLSRALLSTADGGLTWTLGNIRSATATPGVYQLQGASSRNAGLTLVQDTLGNPLANTFNFGWTKS